MIKKTTIAATLALLAAAASFAASPLDKYWAPTGASYPAGSSSKPKDWAPGQYVLLGAISNGKRESVSRMLLVGKEGSQLSMYKAFSKAAYESLVTSSTGLKDGEAVTVPAGAFAGSSYAKTTAKVMGFTVEGEVWMNSAVPINGVVKTSSNKGKAVSELLSFGADGKPKMQ